MTEKEIIDYLKGINLSIDDLENILEFLEDGHYLTGRERKLKNKIWRMFTKLGFREVKNEIL